MLRFTIFFAALTYAYAVKVAVVYIFDPSGASAVKGNVLFTNSDGKILVTGSVSGLAAGEHGFHIHNLGDISTGCGATGPHFNPHNATHGGPSDSVRHVGDLGNIVADGNGVATVNINDRIIALEGEHSIIGRAVVVHEGKDDLGKGGNSESLVTGNAGARLACGVIGIKEDSSSASQMSSPVIIIASIVAFNFRTLLY